MRVVPRKKDQVRPTTAEEQWQEQLQKLLSSWETMSGPSIQKGEEA